MVNQGGDSSGCGKLVGGPGALKGRGFSRAACWFKYYGTAAKPFRKNTRALRFERPRFSMPCRRTPKPMDGAAQAVPLQGSRVLIFESLELSSSFLNPFDAAGVALPVVLTYGNGKR